MDSLDHQPLDRRAEAAQLALERPDTPDATALNVEKLIRDGREYGELKRMYVRPAHARAQGVKVLRLETGIHQAEALGLYESFGFERRTAFGTYRDDPLSLYLEKHI